MIVTSSTAGQYGYPNRAPYAAAKWGMIALILLPVLVAIFLTYRADAQPPHVWLKLSAAIVLSLFLPLLAYSYYFFRRARREAEVGDRRT